MSFVRLSKHEWDRVLPTLPGCTPYASSLWGDLVAQSFGGEFCPYVLRETSRYVPVLVGGSLARDGFVCGHVGYGGVYDARLGALLPVDEQLETLSRLERHLGLRCLRLVTPPGTPVVSITTTQARETVLVALPEQASERWSQYTSNVRNTIRRAERTGLRVIPLGPQHSEQVTTLIHGTQAQVGSPYRTPASLIEALLRQDTSFTLALGAFLDETPVSASIFVRTGGSVAYLFNGWRREHAPQSPNYLVVHAALERCAAMGDRMVDLGFSHQKALLDFKLRWGGRRESYRVADSTAFASVAQGELHGR